MNLLFIAEVLVTAESVPMPFFVSLVPIFIFLGIVFYFTRLSKKRLEAAIKVEREGQELQKEVISLLKEISAKLNK